MRCSNHSMRDRRRSTGYGRCSNFTHSLVIKHVEYESEADQAGRYTLNDIRHLDSTS